MINLLKGLFSDSNEDEEENIFSKSDDKVPEESENKSKNDWEEFSTVEDKEEKSAFEEAREEAKSNEGLKLSESVSSGYANPQDTAKVKYGLNRTGYYNDDISTIPNQKMLDGIINFQRDNNLMLDGRINPSGQILRQINRRVREKLAIIERKKKMLNSINNNINKDDNNISHVCERKKELIKNMKEDLKEYENSKEFGYLDTKGNITTGVGKKVDDEESFYNINWQKDGRDATKDEKSQAYEKFQEMKRNNEYGQQYGADYYKNKTDLKIKQDDIDRYLNEHLEKNIKQLQKTFPEFEDFPQGLQEVLIDICYNTGNVNSDKWPNLHKAIKERDLPSIQKNVHRKDVSEDRNKRIENKIKAITEWKR